MRGRSIRSSVQDATEGMSADEVEQSPILDFIVFRGTKPIRKYSNSTTVPIQPRPTTEPALRTSSKTMIKTYQAYSFDISRIVHSYPLRPITN
jgi:hypothetical protein